MGLTTKEEVSGALSLAQAKFPKVSAAVLIAAALRVEWSRNMKIDDRVVGFKSLLLSLSDRELISGLNSLTRADVESTLRDKAGQG